MPGASSPPAPSAVPGKPTGVLPLSRDYSLSLSTSGPGESYYGYGKAVASVWSTNLKGVRVVPETAGASVGALRSIGAKQVDLALVQSDILDYAYGGTEMFKDKVTNVRAVASLYPQLVQWVVDPDLIRSVGGMKGSQIVVGPPGSGSEANTREILDAGGIAYKDLAKPLFLSSTEAMKAFETRAVDGFCLTDAVPSPAIVEVANSTKIGLLPITGELAQKATAKYRRFSPATIPAGSYKGVSAAVPTLGIQAILVAREDLDSDLIYWLTRTLFEKQPELAASDPLGRALSREGATKDLPAPLHPGAERYYRETGVLK